LVDVVATRELYSGGFEGGQYTDTVTTDSEGRFRFEFVQERRLFRPDLLSGNPHVNQILKVTFDGYEYLIWTFMKQDFQLGTESTSGRLQLECDLSQFEEGSTARLVQCKNNGVHQSYE